MAGMIDAAAGTRKRMAEIDAMDAPATTPVSAPAPALGAMPKKKPGMLDRMKSMMGFGAKVEK